MPLNTRWKVDAPEPFVQPFFKWLHAKVSDSVGPNIRVRQASVLDHHIRRRSYEGGWGEGGCAKTAGETAAFMAAQEDDASEDEDDESTDEPPSKYK